jgi:hypothetical protein
MSRSEHKFETNTIAEEFDGSKSDGLSKRATIFRKCRGPLLPSSSTDYRCSRFFSIKNPNPPPPQASIHDAVLTPEASAGFFSRLWFIWLTPLLSLGYARPLEASDLYKLPDERSSTRVANAILTSFERRRRYTTSDWQTVRLIQALNLCGGQYMVSA